MEDIMKKSIYRISSIVLLLLVGIAASAQPNADAPDDILVFVNKSMPMNSIPVDELKQLFLKKKTTLSDGGKIICVNPSENAVVRKRFREKVLGMTETEEAIYWQDQQIRSQMSPPVQFANTPKAVFNLQRSISYGFRKDVPEGVVKVVLVIR
jgi:hypothetical protein